MSIIAEKQKLKKYNFCAAKDLEIQRLLKLHKWARHGQIMFILAEKREKAKKLICDVTYKQIVVMVFKMELFLRDVKAC
jgi:hypothetical protein